MKVLLVSPLDPEKPGNLRLLTGGENTFTKSLLDEPPKNIEYSHYQKALQEGKIAYSKWQFWLSLLMKLRLLPPDAGFQCLLIKDRFDLIHCHSYCLKLENYSGAVVLSDSSSNFLFLKDYLGWPVFLIKMAYQLRKFIHQKLEIYDPNLNLKEALLIVWSEFAKGIHLKLGALPGKIFVIPPGIKQTNFKKKKHQGINLLFVGVWFERKGGRLVMEAYQALKKRCPQLHLFIVGQKPNDLTLPEGVSYWRYLPRKIILKKIYPITDILVLVPPLAEGYGLVVSEAASFGIPAVVSRVYALPEIVNHQKTGLVVKPEEAAELIRALGQLISDQQLRLKLGREAKNQFLKRFDIKMTNQELLVVYREALAARKR